MTPGKDQLPVGLVEVPQGYAEWLADLKSRIHTAQQRAALAANRELAIGRLGAIF